SGAIAPACTSSSSNAGGKPEISHSSANDTTCSSNQAASVSSTRMPALPHKVCPGIEVRALAQLLIEAALLFGHDARHDDLNDRIQVALTARGLGQATPRQSQALSCLRARRYLQAYRPAGRGHLDRDAQYRLPGRE